jgi:hypothetical protein
MAADGEHPPTRHLHVAFVSPTREDVEAFWRAGLSAGGTDDGEPGERSQYTESYYGAFVRDPDGNSVEAVIHSDVRRGGNIDLCGSASGTSMVHRRFMTPWPATLVYAREDAGRKAASSVARGRLCHSSRMAPRRRRISTSPFPLQTRAPFRTSTRQPQWPGTSTTALPRSGRISILATAPMS